MNYMTVGLKRKVSLALLPIDDLTNRIITGSLLRVYIVEENKPSIRKPDGYHVFCDLKETEVTLCLEGPIYQKQTLRLSIKPDKVKVYQIRMLPGIAYPLPKGITILKGTLPKDSRLRVFVSGKKKEYRLLGDYDPVKQKDALTLFLHHKISLIGKVLCISGKEKEPEFFRVTDQKDQVCMLEKPLSKAYARTDALIYPAYETVSDQDGNFFLPMNSHQEEENCTCILMKEDRIEKTWQLVLKSGEENRITEDMWKGDD
ncbi:MAG: hypothetical protein J1E61_08240 [Lachnospiraceae bacterium]|nr:hypothetical protein [Lachnospiraceae bacterium]